MIMFVLAGLLACGGDAEALTDPASVAHLADAIVAAPANADTLLSEAGTTRDAFEDRLFEIAEDAAQTRAYLAARKK
ncbi:MAG: hypothetical protein ACI8PZ_003132 [Myxococcota bacterium]|jgi:hypothetical protein